MFPLLGALTVGHHRHVSQVLLEFLREDQLLLELVCSMVRRCGLLVVCRIRMWLDLMSPASGNPPACFGASIRLRTDRKHNFRCKGMQKCARHVRLFLAESVGRLLPGIPTGGLSTRSSPCTWLTSRSKLCSTPKDAWRRARPCWISEYVGWTPNKQSIGGWFGFNHSWLNASNAPHSCTQSPLLVSRSEVPVSGTELLSRSGGCTQPGAADKRHTRASWCSCTCAVSRSLFHNDLGPACRPFDVLVGLGGGRHVEHTSHTFLFAHCAFGPRLPAIQALATRSCELIGRYPLLLSRRRDR